MPPKSAAMVFRPTATIHSAPNANATSTSATLATTQEVRVSMDCVVNSGPGSGSRG
jgi:hypothetical protein